MCIHMCIYIYIYFFFFKRTSMFFFFKRKTKYFSKKTCMIMAKAVLTSI